jgi:hypothetical protein
LDKSLISSQFAMENKFAVLQTLVCVNNVVCFKNK